MRLQGVHLTSLGPFPGEVHHGRAAQRQDAHAWVIQGSVLMRHDAVPWLVCIQQHMVWRLPWPEHLSISCEPLQQRCQPPASRKATPPHASVPTNELLQQVDAMCVTAEHPHNLQVPVK